MAATVARLGLRKLFSKITRHNELNSRKLSDTSYIRRGYRPIIFLRGQDGILTDSSARDFLYLLEPEERALLLKHLQSVDEEGEIVVPPEKEVTPPTAAQLRSVAYHSAMPFIGFGFLDNLIMIVAGEYIDLTIGTALGISTMAAAAFGNAISDIAGVGSAGYIELIAFRIGARPPALTAEQIDLRKTRWSANIGRAVGVTIGCILGMFPLCFFSDSKEETSESEE